MTWIVLASFGGPLLLSLSLTWLIRRWAVRVGFIDLPGGHKQHGRPVALGGGAAIFISACAPILVGTAAAWWLAGTPTADAAAPPDWTPNGVARHLEGIASRLPVVGGIVMGALVLHVVGLIDDRRPLRPRAKFAAQFAVALGVAGPLGIRIIEAAPAPISILLTVLWIVGITNAFNFLDNMDGLSAGVGAIAAAIFALASLRAGQVFVPVMALVLSGTLAGYLVFNFHPASIFMGDAGSMVIGFLLSVLTVLTNYYDPARNPTPLGIAVPLVVLAVPIYDVASVVTLRLRLGLSPLKGDRRHFSHRLVARGLSIRGAVLTIYLATAATGLSAIVLPAVDWGGAALLLAQCVCVVVMIAILEHRPGDVAGRS